MRAEIISVGTELLLGQIADTNARWMSERLAAIGVDVLHRQTVGDNLERIVESLELGASRAEVILVTGGLGPTQDDLTRDAVAVFAGRSLVRHPELEDMLRAKFRGFSARSMPSNNLRQADVPDGARTIAPDRGTAPGLIVELPTGVRIYAVPGVPDEMVEMMSGTIVPELEAETGEVIVSRSLRITGMGESAVGEALTDLFEGSSNPTVAYLASMGEVKVRLTAKARSAEAADEMLEPLRPGGRGPTRRRRVQRGRPIPRGGDPRAAPRAGSHPRVRRVVDRGKRERAPYLGPWRIRRVRRCDRRIHRTHETRPARRVAGDDRRPGRCERDLREGDGRGGPPRPHDRSRTLVDGGCRAGASRGEGAAEPCGSPSTPGRAPTRAGSRSRASATG